MGIERLIKPDSMGIEHIIKPDSMGIEHLIKPNLPIGYRFKPTDEEIVMHYLMNKVFKRHIPPSIIKNITSSQIYSKPPMDLVGDVIIDEDDGDQSEWYFFVHMDKYFHCKRREIRMVRNGIGFWLSHEEGDPIYNFVGDVLAFKDYFAYYLGPKEEKSCWRMEEYRLCSQYGQEKRKIDEWVLAKIIKSKENDSETIESSD